VVAVVIKGHRSLTTATTRWPETLRCNAACDVRVDQSVGDAAFINVQIRKLRLTSYDFHKPPAVCGCVTFALHPYPRPIADLFSGAAMLHSSDNRRPTNHICADACGCCFTFHATHLLCVS
jgi:hypothetical protein